MSSALILKWWCFNQDRRHLSLKALCFLNQNCRARNALLFLILTVLLVKCHFLGRQLILFLVTIIFVTCQSCLPLIIRYKKHGWIWVDRVTMIVSSLQWLMMKNCRWLSLNKRIKECSKQILLILIYRIQIIQIFYHQKLSILKSLWVGWGFRVHLKRLEDIS